MKIFKDWEKQTEAFVIFLGKEALLQSRRARKLLKEFKTSGDIDCLKSSSVQCGAAMEAVTLFRIAKSHFKLDTFNRKHINNGK
jgi:hypothetical protein